MRILLRAAMSLVVAGFLASTSCLAGTRDEALYARAEHYQAEALRLLERLVNIDSGTGDEKGLGQVVEVLRSELSELGAKIELVSAAPMAGKNIVATFKGKGKGR